MTSMIPRPFSVHEAKRLREENAREAERRTSARNASNSKIGAGGSLELAGGIQVVENGDISVRDGGVVRVTSEIQDPQGVPYTIEAKLGNSQDPGYGGIPALVFRNDTLSENTFSSLSSIQGFDLSGRAEAGDYRAGFGINAEPGYTEGNLSCSGGDSQPGYSVVRVTPGGFVLLANDADGNKIGNVRTNGPNAPMKIGGPKGLDVEGPLTNNGQPVGGTPAWADITGKPSSYPPEAHDHTIAQINGLQVALDGKGGKTESSFYIATGSKGNFDVGNQAISTPSYQATGSTKNLGTPGGGQIALTDAGIYSVVASVALFTDATFTTIKPATGRSFVDISDGSGNAYSRTPIPVGEDQSTGNHAGMKLDAGTVLKFNIIQTTGGTAFYRIRIWITKHP